MCKMHRCFSFHSTIVVFRDVGQFHCILRLLFAIAYFDYSLFSKYIIIRHISYRFITSLMDILTIFLSMIRREYCLNLLEFTKKKNLHFYIVSHLCTDKILCQNLYLCRQNKPYLLWLSKAIHCKLYIPWCLKETITRKRTFLWIYTTARIDHFLQFLPVSTFSKCRKIGHKTNMVQRLNSLNTPYHTVLERGFWIIATNVKYDTNRLKMKVYVVLNKDGVPYVIHMLIIFPPDVLRKL